MSDDKRWYKLVFKQLQPIHIGMGSYGVVNETRIFIPGWTMWGALTKAFNLQKGKDLSENQEIFKEISCFYPCFDENGNNPLLPNIEDGEFHLGDYPEDKFRAMFVDTFTSTSIKPLSRTAKDESLHEIDVILPNVKYSFNLSREEKQVYWVGILRIENQNVRDFLKEGFKITVGGDVRYGLGLMERVKIVNIKEEKEDEQSKDLFDKLRKANYLKSENRAKYVFPIELVVESAGYKGNNLIINNPMYCFMPNTENDNNPKLEMEKGVLSKQ